MVDMNLRMLEELRVGWSIQINYYSNLYSGHPQPYNIVTSNPHFKPDQDPSSSHALNRNL